MRWGFLKNAATRHGRALGGAITGIGGVGVDAALHDLAPAGLQGRAGIALRHRRAAPVPGTAADWTRSALDDPVLRRLTLFVLLLLVLLGRAWCRVRTQLLLSRLGATRFHPGLGCGPDARGLMAAFFSRFLGYLRLQNAAGEEKSEEENRPH